MFNYTIVETLLFSGTCIQGQSCVCVCVCVLCVRVCFVCVHATSPAIFACEDEDVRSLARIRHACV